MIGYAGGLRRGRPVEGRIRAQIGLTKCQNVLLVDRETIGIRQRAEEEAEARLTRSRVARLDLAIRADIVL